MLLLLGPLEIKSPALLAFSNFVIFLEVYTMVVVMNHVEPWEYVVESGRVGRVSGSNALDPRRKISLTIRLETLGQSSLHFKAVLLNFSLVFEYTLESHR